MNIGLFNLGWRPSPSFVRFQREARRRAARAQRIELRLRARSFVARRAPLLVGALAVVTLAVFAAFAAATIARRDLAQVEQARQDVAAYRALALSLVSSESGRRLQVRLSASGRDEMLVLLERMTTILEDERGEVRP